MTDDFAFERSESTDRQDENSSTARKHWKKPEVILGEIDQTKHVANTVSDGTGNLQS